MTNLANKKEILAALCALFGPFLVVPIFFIIIGKDEFIRFWAMQSLLTFGIFWAVREVLAFVPLLSALLFIVIIFTWLIFSYKAWQGDEWEAPVIGVLSRRLLAKFKSR
jgi:uncharacterized membrane protein